VARQRKPKTTGQVALSIPEQVPRVAIILFGSVVGHEILRGIARYVRSNRPWHILLEIGSVKEPTEEMNGWFGDGMIAQVRGLPLLEWMSSRNIPSVTSNPPTITRQQIPFPAFDLQQEAELAVGHFYERGLRQLAFCPHGSGVDWGRKQPFLDAAKTKGIEALVYQPSSPTLLAASWEQQFRDLCQWIKQLPKPIGIFAANDQRGHQIIDACNTTGFRVPEDVAVLGDDNDQAVCELCNPPLSSIQRPHEELGYRCAALLDRLMQGKKIPVQPKLPPVTLVHRQSTDVLAINDLEVVEVYQFIRRNLNRAFNIKDLLREIPIGRRALEQRFSRATGTTIGREIRRMRINRANDLLISTQLSMPEVARRCGFASASRLADAFRRDLKKTPTSFRAHRS